MREKNQIQVFANKAFGQLEVLMIDGKPYFPAAECAKVLGYSKPGNAVERHCKGALKQGILTNGGKQTKNFIPEGDLYRLIIRSKLPEAELFEAWVFDKILPTIRKHGGYIVDELLEQLAESEEARENYIKELAAERRKHIKTLKTAEKTCKELEKAYKENEILEGCVETLLPKAEYCNTILDCENSIPVTVIAKDYGMTAAAFNKLLHSVGIQYKIGERSENNGTWVLYQKFSGYGFTETKTFHKSGKAIVYTCWTQNGRRFIYNVLMSRGIFPECERHGEGGLC